MSSYTITIAPDDRARATTTLRVEVSDTAARVTELLVRAGDGDGLTAGQLPAVDLDQLLHALLPTRAAAILQAAPSAPTEAQVPADARVPAEVASAEVASAEPVAPAEPEVTPLPAAEPVAPVDDRQAAASEPAPATGRTSKSTAGVRPRRGGTAAKKTATAGTRRTARTGGSATAAKAARTSTTTKATKSTKPTEATKSTRATKAAKAAKSVKAVKAVRATEATGATVAKKSTAKTSAPRERAYRRAPEDLVEVYQQAGSTAAVADHYGVPRHTAYGWIRKLNNRATAA